MTKSFSAQEKNLFAIIAVMIIPIAGLSIDVYSPALPMMVSYFHASVSLLQLSVTIFLISYGFSQFFSGFLVQAFGIRKATLFSMLIFILCSIMICANDNIYFFLILRILQGISCGVFVVANRTIFLTLFTGLELQQKLSYINIAWAASPIIAPSIGGYLSSYINWQSCFLLLVTYSCILLAVVYFKIEETIFNFTPLSWNNILGGFKAVFSNKRYCCFLLGGGVSYAHTMVFILIGTFTIQNNMHYSAVFFGYCALVMGVAWLLGSILARIFIEQQMENQVFIVACILFINSLIMLLTITYFKNVYIIIIQSFIAHLFASICLNRFFISAMHALDRKYAALAGGITGSVINVLTFLISSSLAVALPKNSHGLAVSFTILGLMLIIIILLLKSSKLVKIDL